MTEKWTGILVFGGEEYGSETFLSFHKPRSFPVK